MLVALQIFCIISLYSAHTPALLIEEVRVLKSHRRGDKDFLLKMGDRVFHIGGLSIEWEGVTIIYVVYSSNAHCSESILINQCSQ